MEQVATFEIPSLENQAGDFALWWEHEQRAWAQGAKLVAGIDEAGRGPLAGPVVAAAVILPTNFDLRGINDSKKLSPRARQRAAERIRAEAIAFAIGVAEPEEIDRINILQATHAAMRRAFAGLSVSADFVLVDGLPVPRLHPHCLALVGGDARSASIAAASILAKTERDAQMQQLDEHFPAYGFARHKGYGTAQHLAALAEHGPCPAHRRSFRPVADAVRLE